MGKGGVQFTKRVQVAQEPSRFFYCGGARSVAGDATELATQRREEVDSLWASIQKRRDEGCWDSDDSIVIVTVRVPMTSTLLAAKVPMKVGTSLDFDEDRKWRQ
ncbi:hypothetical protein U1Q18_023307 [Sarracenia purpurea var. burkii]